ncbi:hypothetical protein CYMTET_12438 [Cymbomonas tetramitiformis]|uniref:Response regulatory domain-containing protein n=1 Tax=Cymbomonas tetramitiformis TaxID=36881 RepID=A0AAE0GKH7_9CHLO|nr:hypothetical protein CYMTET_12438 [Cymbomonas tetramitiformis]
MQPAGAMTAFGAEYVWRIVMMMWQSLLGAICTLLGRIWRTSIRTLLWQHHKEELDFEDEQDRLKYMEQIHRNIPGAVFHLSAPKSNAPCSVQCVYCSNGSLDTFGIPSSRLTHLGCNFLDVLASIIEPSYQQDFLDRFEDMRKNAISLEWKGMLKLSPSVPDRPKWVYIQIQSIIYSQQEAAGSAISASLSLQNYIGYAWDCSAEQEAQKLSIEEAMRTSDLRFFHVAQHGLAELLAVVDLVQEELRPRQEFTPPSVQRNCHPFDQHGEEQLESLLEEFVQVCRRGKADCLMRTVMNQVSDGSYQQQLCIMTGQKIVDHYVQECGIGISPALDAEAAGAHIQLDPMLLYVVLSNLLTNALKYGDQMVKPQINVKVLMADASDVLPPVAVELWNAPGSNHAEFTENSTRILQARGASTANNFLSDGIGMSTIKMCLKYTSWTMDHQVNSNGTTMRITLPGALVSSRQAAADTDDSSLPSLVDPNGIPSGGDGAGIGEGLHSNQQSQQSAFDEGSAPLQVEDQFPPGVKIAMLDDSMMLRMMYQRQLRKMGVKTFWVEGATETEILGFAKLVMDHDVDIVVLDQNLSEVIGLEVSSHINGCTVMRDLLCMGFSGVCVTRTAYHSPESIEEYLAIGFDDVLSKTEQLIDQLNDNWKHYKTLLVARRAPALTGFYRMTKLQH